MPQSVAAPKRPGHREALLDAAQQLILEKGFSATTARDLVAASGTNLGSIGYHFGSREALLSAALEDLFNEWTELLVAAAFSEEDVPPQERLTASWKATLSSLDEHSAIIRAFVEALAYAERSPEFRELMREHYRRVQATVADVVEAAMGPAAVERGADPMTIALFVIAIFDGLAVQHRMSPDDTPTGDQLVGALAAAAASIRERGGDGDG
jgi:AcrR family transcriptional regulator